MVFEGRPFQLEDGKLFMGVGLHRAETWEVLGAARHTPLGQPLVENAGEDGDPLGVVRVDDVEHLADPITQRALRQFAILVIALGQGGPGKKDGEAEDGQNGSLAHALLLADELVDRPLDPIIRNRRGSSGINPRGVRQFD